MVVKAMTNSSYVLWRHSYSIDSNQPPTCVSKTGFKAVKTHRHGRQTGMMSCNQIRSVFHLKTANIFAVLSISQVFISEHVPMKHLLQSFEMVSIQNSKKNEQQCVILHLEQVHCAVGEICRFLFWILFAYSHHRRLGHWRNGFLKN